MSMTIDTLELYEALKQEFPESQAQALSKALKRVEESRLDELATKGDLLNQEHRLKNDIIKMVAGMLIAQTGLIIAAFFVVARLMGP